MDTMTKTEAMELLNIDEVCTLLKCTRRTVYTYLKTGRLKAFKLGGQWRVTKADLQAFIEAQRG